MLRSTLPILVAGAFATIALSATYGCFHSQKAAAAANSSASATGLDQAGASKIPSVQNNNSQRSHDDLGYRGELPYNGEPPGYYGSSGNSFSGW